MKLQWLSPIEHLERFDSVIDRDDIDQLRLYFRIDGIGSFIKSPMGGMLDNANMFASNYAPCKYCGGVIGDGESDDDVGGMGFLIGVGKWDKKTRKTYDGIVSNRNDGTYYDVEDGADCLACGTRGWRQTNRRKSERELTAQPRKDAGIHRESIPMGADVKIGTCAIVGSILDRADVLFPLASQSLASVYGRNNYGTLGLWHLTPSGKTILRGNSEDMTPEAYFVKVRSSNQGSEKKSVTAQLAMAEDQAKWLKEYSARSWNAASFVYRCGV